MTQLLRTRRSSKTRIIERENEDSKEIEIGAAGGETIGGEILVDEMPVGGGITQLDLIVIIVTSADGTTTGTIEGVIEDDDQDLLEGSLRH